MDDPLSMHTPEFIGKQFGPDWKMFHALAGLFAILQFLFATEHLVKCFSHNINRSLWYFSGIAITFMPVIISGYLGLETYKNYFVLFHILYSWTFNVQ